MIEEYLKDARALKEIERSIQTTYKRDTFSKFLKALDSYDLIQEGDKIAVGMSGGKDSLLLAKMFQALKRFSRVDFELDFIAMDPGYSKENREKLENICRYLDIPVKIYESDIFEVTERVAKDNPCYLCARMRRGFLYSKVQELGFNKLALGHHFNDVIETTMINVIWNGSFKTMMPKLKSQNFQGLELIRPLYLIEEKDIIRWLNFSGIIPMDEACPIVKVKKESQRLNIKNLIENLRDLNPVIEKNIFKSAENVSLKQILGYDDDEKKHFFLDDYDKRS
ncbi:MAG: tRNA 2-thiocytidine biosynthesis TtcA family protein [Tissierellia bacterium]|nr:tRNA 2-thiocytidine biosynthesis TtcA family protein [Tissierellia bacterium]